MKWDETTDSTNTLGQTGVTGGVYYEGWDL